MLLRIVPCIFFMARLLFPTNLLHFTFSDSDLIVRLFGRALEDSVLFADAEQDSTLGHPFLTSTLHLAATHSPYSAAAEPSVTLKVRTVPSITFQSLTGRPGMHFLCEYYRGKIFSKPLIDLASQK